MADYGATIAFTKTQGQHDIAEILLDLLREEIRADLGLSGLAEDQIKPDAKWSTMVEKSEKETT